MLKTTAMLRDELSNYSYPDNRISRMAKDNTLFFVTRGLYETNPNVPGYVLAGCIYGRSYLSFEFALSYYGLIPERVTTYTSATFKKKKAKEYNNYFGKYTYKDIPESAFSYGIDVEKVDGYDFAIACPEKAVCDTLYQAKPMHNRRELKEFLFENMRIEKTVFSDLDSVWLRELAKRYNSTNLKLLLKLKELKDERSN